jgi:nucleoside-diphosphate-sugar epimerase
VQDKKLLITGATGSVARAIVQALAGQNEVWAAARFTDSSARAELDRSGVKTFAWTLGDGDFSGLPTDFDYVVHAAANIFDTANDYDAAIGANAEGTGLLMSHLRGVGAFLFVSSLQVYKEVTDRSAARREDEPLGSHPRYAPSYSVGKVASEAVVRTMCRLFNLPTTIGRLGVNYGANCAGVPDAAFRQMLKGEDMIVPPRGQSWCGLVYNADIVKQVEPLLLAASVPATIVNWAGDEGVEYRELLDHMAELAGLSPRYVEQDGVGPVAGWGDPTRRIAITGPAQDWRSAVRETLARNFPELSIPAR